MKTLDKLRIDQANHHPSRPFQGSVWHIALRSRHFLEANTCSFSIEFIIKSVACKVHVLNYMRTVSWVLEG